jgi:hypothetical protein
MSETDPQPQTEPTEEELRAAIEEQMRSVTVDDVLIQTAVSLLNVGGYRAGLAPGGEGQRDLDQVQRAIEGLRALMPTLEASGAEELPAIRDTLARLQLAYARLRGGEGHAPAAGGDEPGREQPEPGAAGQEGDAPGPGPAQSSGRLWVPGQ